MSTAKDFSPCPRCTARMSPSQAACWRCGWSLQWAARIEADTGRDANGGSDKAASDRPRGIRFGLEGLFLSVAVVAVVASLIRAMPGLGVLFSVLLAPPLVRTWLVLGRRRELGRAIGIGERIGLFLGSFAVTAVIVSVVTVATVGTFCATCLGLYAASQHSDKLVGPFMIAAGSVAITVFGILIWLFTKWIRARWRRDTANR